MLLVFLKQSDSSQLLALDDLELPGLGHVPQLHLCITLLPFSWPGQQQEALNSAAWRPLSSSTFLAVGTPGVVPAGNRSCLREEEFLLLSLLGWKAPSRYFF